MRKGKKYIKMLFTEPSVDNAWIQYGRYSVVGAATYCFDVGMLYACTEFLQIHYMVSAVIGYFGAMGVNYLLSTLWVFSKRFDKRDFFLFALIGVCGLVVNALLLYILTERADLYYIYSKNIALFVIFSITFFIRKKFIYRQASPPLDRISADGDN